MKTVGRDGYRFLHPPRTGGTSIGRGWRLGPPEYYGHALPREGETFRYGFVRNPFDRVVSLYHLLWPRGDRSFEEWVMDGMKAPAYEGVSICAPCATWLRGANFVGRFEHREDHLAALARLLERPMPTIHLGQTERRPYQEYYNEQTRRVVEVVYREDFLLYDYGWETR